VTSLRPALAQLRASADRAAHLSNQLLVLARSEPGFDAFLDFAPVDLCALARDICSDWVPTALERDIDLGVVTAAQPLVVEGDATLLGELLGNLLDNAIRYGRDHGNIMVTVRAEPDVQLIAEDDGAGIPEFEHARVLERFHRVAGSPGDGCGLGLAIVNEIARAHHASVRISSPDRGSGTKIVVDFSAALRSLQIPETQDKGPGKLKGSRS
jgi:two-component system sensor histidine kinase TctE